MSNKLPSLAEPAREWVSQRVASGDWPDADAYLNALVERDRDDTERLTYVRAAIAEAKASGTSGRTIDTIIAEGRARHRHG